MDFIYEQSHDHKNREEEEASFKSTLMVGINLNYFKNVKDFRQIDV